MSIVLQSGNSSAETGDRLPEAAVLSDPMIGKVVTLSYMHRAHFCCRRQSAFLHRGSSEEGAQD